MPTLKLFIPGKPFGKERPKFARRGKFVATYTPKKTLRYEDSVRSLWSLENAAKLPAPLTMKDNVRIAVNAVFEIPKSYNQKNRDEIADGLVSPNKPDWDNIGKIVCDSLNGVAWVDDSIIRQATVAKRYAFPGEYQGVHLEITWGK